MLDGGRWGPERDFYRAARRGVTPGIMELQRTCSVSGPLSPAYTGQVPYNYNQLEGRFKQLQGELSCQRPACPGDLPPGVLRFICAIWFVTQMKTGGHMRPAPKPLVGCEHPIHYLKETVSHSLLQKSHHLECLSPSPVFLSWLALFVVRYLLPTAHTFSVFLAVFAP